MAKRGLKSILKSFYNTQQKFLSVHHGPSSMRVAQDTESNEIVVALKEFLVN